MSRKSRALTNLEPLEPPQPVGMTYTLRGILPSTLGSSKYSLLLRFFFFTKMLCVCVYIYIYIYIYISFVLHAWLLPHPSSFHPYRQHRRNWRKPAVLPPTTNLTDMNWEWSQGSRLACHCLSPSNVSQPLVADSNCKYLHQTAFQLPVLKWRHLAAKD